jgi:hypothetical protein
VTYRIEFAPRAADSTVGLPHGPFKALHALLVDVSRAPRDVTFPDGPPASSSRWAPFDGGLGMVHLEVDDDALAVRVVDVLWVGS